MNSASSHALPLGKLGIESAPGPGLCRIRDAAESLDAAPQPIGVDFDHVPELLGQRQIEILDGFVDLCRVLIAQR